LIEEDASETVLQRPRSGTAGSRETQGSLSSRGDLIPSDEEEDAIALDDEFALALSRRITNDGGSSGKSSKRPRVSRTSTRTISSKSTRSGRKSRRSSSKKSIDPMSPLNAEPPSMIELGREEDKVRIEEELEVEQKRRAAQRAAMEQGLVKEEPISLDGSMEVFEIGAASSNPTQEQDDEEVEAPDPVTSRPPPIPSRKSSGSGPEPFPDFANDHEEHSREPKPP
jgi:hypothetical protein